MKTATSEMLIEKTVNPISRAPLQRGRERAHAVFHVAGYVFHYDDGVVDDKAARDAKRHEREIVDTEAEQVHHRERADE